MDLVVENVKCFKERQTLDLSDGKGKPARWTIILAENGTGKTTLLKFLSTFTNLESQEEYRNWEPYFDFILSFPGAGIIALNKIHKGILSELNGSTFSSNPLGIFPAQIPRAPFRLYSYGASRRMGSGSLSETKNPDPLATLFSDQPTLLNAEAWLLETDFAIANAKGDTKKYLQKRYEQVKQTLKNLLPDVLDFRIKEITKTQTQAVIEVETPYGWVAMKELSYGYLTFIGWVVDLAARMFDRYPDSPNPLAEPAIVLVDEIDLHLHPKWQRQIVQFLTEIFSETQFIVTAHSPLIVQAAPDANLVLLKREGGSVKIYNNMEREAIAGWRIDQVLASDLFGLESPRPPQFDRDLKRQKELLEKPALANGDKTELAEIGRRLEQMAPAGEMSAETAKVFQRALKILHPE